MQDPSQSDIPTEHKLLAQQIEQVRNEINSLPPYASAQPPEQSLEDGYREAEVDHLRQRIRGQLEKVHTRVKMIVRSYPTPAKLAKDLLRSLIAINEGDDARWIRGAVLLPETKEQHLGKIENIVLNEMAADVSRVTDRYGQTSIHHLAGIRGRPYPRLLDSLCGRFPREIDRQDNEGKTALHVATRNTNLPAVRVLMRHGASCCVENSMGQTPLLQAAVALKYARPTTSYGWGEITTYLASHSIRQGVDTSKVDLHGASIELTMKGNSSVSASVKRGFMKARTRVKKIDFQLSKVQLAPPLREIVFRFLYRQEAMSILLRPVKSKRPTRGARESWRKGRTRGARRGRAPLRPAPGGSLGSRAEKKKGGRTQSRAAVRGRRSSLVIRINSTRGASTGSNRLRSRLSRSRLAERTRNKTDKTSKTDSKTSKSGHRRAHDGPSSRSSRN